MIEQEIETLRLEIASLTNRVEQLNREIRPVWDAETSIKQTIRRTHGGRAGIDPIIYQRDGCVTRASLFDQLLRISINHGPTKAKRAELASRLRAYQKRYEMLVKELKRKRKPKPSSDNKKTAQGSLF